MKMLNWRPFISTPPESIPTAFLGKSGPKGGGAEDRFDEMVWRIRRWQLQGSLTCQGEPIISPGTAHPTLIYLRTGGSEPVFSAGENSTTSDGPFADEKEINLWRRTLLETYRNEDGETRTMHLSWGASANYELKSDPDVEGGYFESQLILGFTDDSGSYTLSTNPSYGAEAPNVEFIIDPYRNPLPVPLYGGTAWAGTINFVPYQWWPWELGDGPTWNYITGEQLRVPGRRPYVLE